MGKSSFEIRQSAQEMRPGWWSWSVWLEGPPDRLKQVNAVTWILHETFPTPRVKVTNRAKKFRLDSAGWGEFEIRAEVEVAGSKRVRLSKWLQLQNAGQARTSRPPSVYLSGSIADEDVIETVGELLTGLGVDVRKPGDVASCSSLAAETQKAILASDLVVSVFSDVKAPWVAREFVTALEFKKPVASITIGEAVAPREAATQAFQFRVGDRKNAAAELKSFAAALKGKLSPGD